MGMVVGAEEWLYPSKQRTVSNLDTHSDYPESMSDYPRTRLEFPH